MTDAEKRSKDAVLNEPSNARRQTREQLLADVSSGKKTTGNNQDNQRGGTRFDIEARNRKYTKADNLRDKTLFMNKFRAGARTYQGNNRATANRLLTKRWEDTCFEKHKQRLVLGKS